jgi:hypothetical protein
MDFKALFKKLVPHIAIIAGFIAISYIYFSPVIEGKVLQQSDMTHHRGMVNQIDEYNEKHPDNPTLWTPYSFSGMPTYMIDSGENPNVFHKIKKFLRLKLPYRTVGILFMYLLGFYVLGISLRLNKWLSLIGAIGFAFASYNLIIIGAGHITKAYSIAYMPIILAGVILIYRKRYMLGGTIAMLGIGMEVSASHPQMAYYVGLTALILIIARFVEVILKQKDYSTFIRASLVLLLVAVLAFLPAIKQVWTTYNYSKKTIRGEQILEKKEENASGDGLDKSYALSWSYGKWETLTLLIPNFHGGSSHGVLDESSNVYKELKQKNVPNAKRITQSLSAYWGEMPFTEGPYYIGAILCFLFVLGLYNVKGYLKWGIVATVVITIMLSWGQNFEWFTNIFFNYVPLYDKFRAVASILVVVSLVVPILGFLGLKNFIRDKDSPQARKHLKKAFYIVGGISLFFALFPGMFFDFSSPADQRYLSQGYPQWLVDLLREDRQALLRADAFRSLIFIALAFGSLWFYSKNKLKTQYLYVLIGVLVIVDLWGVDKRYLSNDDFMNKQRKTAQFSKSKADQFILQDNSYFRVLNLQNPFKEAQTSYFHHSIGGYHGAKLRRYQDLIERHLQPTTRKIGQALSSKNNQMRKVNSVLANANCLNMLNGKYIIYNPKARPIKNPNSMGPAWFVDKIKWVKDASAEIGAIDATNLRNTAIVHQNFKEDISGITESSDSLANIKLVHNEPNHLIYETKAASKNLAVLSEIYYEDGWKATLDGEPIPIYRANYALRALEIPAGEHKLELTFEPDSYYAGVKISKTASYFVGILLLLILGYGAFRLYRDYRKPGGKA